MPLVCAKSLADAKRKMRRFYGMKVNLNSVRFIRTGGDCDRYVAEFKKKRR